MRKWLISVCLSGASLVGSLVFPARVLAAEQLVFSDDGSSDLSGWETDLGTRGSWELKNGRIEGLMMAPFARSDLMPILHSNLSDGYRFELDFFPLEGADRNLALGVTAFGFYDLHWVGDSLFVQRQDRGSLIWEKRAPFALQNGQAYALSITHQAGLIEIQIDGRQVFSYQDPSPPTIIGRPALRVATGSVAPSRSAFDNIRLFAFVDEPVTSLAVPLLKQTDPRWGALEYDHAASWSPELASIADWGCALTSLTMIMQYHGISQLLDLQPLTPATLNIWLQSQPDGYLGEGLLNWVAATRLIKQLNQRFDTPNLEYARHLLTATQSAQTAIQVADPPILQLPNHFVVATGVLPEDDFLINDPAFEFQQFSQHLQPLVSSRTLTPSQTDLSYFVLTLPLAVQVQITDPSGQILDPAQYSQVAAAANVNGASVSDAINIIEIPKPTAGTYQVQLSAEQLARYQIGVWSYDQAANPSDLSISTYLSQQPKTFFLNSSTLEQPATMTYSTNLSSVIALLTQLVAQQPFQLVPNSWRFDRLLRLALVHGQSANTFSQYQTALRNYLTTQPPPFPDDIASALLEELDSVQMNI